MRPSWIALLCALATALVAVSVSAGEAPQPAEAPAAHEGHAAAPAHAAAGHGEAADGHAEHGAAHVPHFSDINWVHGFLGESEEGAPSLLWRKPGTPSPLVALLINFAILYWLLYRFGMPPIRRALKERRAKIMAGMDEAAKMKAEAEEQLASYEDKLAHVDSEIERAKQQAKELGEAERERVLREAAERRERMAREAHTLVEQELKAARESLYQEAVEAAMVAARAEIEKQLNPAEQQRLARQYLETVPGAVEQIGGRA